MALPRKHRFRSPRGWSEPLDDLHDYVQPWPQRASTREREGAISVTDDWPEQIPVGDAELRVIEGHLRGELDKLFGPLP